MQTREIDVHKTTVRVVLSTEFTCSVDNIKREAPSNFRGPHSRVTKCRGLRPSFKRLSTIPKKPGNQEKSKHKVTALLFCTLSAGDQVCDLDDLCEFC